MRSNFRRNGDEGVRTPDLCIANAPLSQLSYVPMWRSRADCISAAYECTSNPRRVQKHCSRRELRRKRRRRSAPHVAQPRSVVGPVGTGMDKRATSDLSTFQPVL